MVGLTFANVCVELPFMCVCSSYILIRTHRLMLLMYTFMETAELVASKTRFEMQ